MSISLLLADDHAMVREGIKVMLKDSDINVVAEAGDAEEAVQKAAQHKPNVVLLDIRFEDLDGIATLDKLRRAAPESHVIMLSTYDNPTYVARSVAHGATDYVVKDSSPDEIIDAIRRAAIGEPPEEDSLYERVKQTMERRGERPDEDFPLTRRELQVLRHLALGLSNKEIGRSLEISVETVKEHVQNILRKLNAADRTQAAVWAVKKGLVE